MTDGTTPKCDKTRCPLPRWTEWLTFGLAASAWGSFCLGIAAKLLEDALGSTWGGWLRRSDIEMVFLVASPMLVFASLASYVALRAAGRHTRSNTLGLAMGLLFLVGLALLARPFPGSGIERPRRTKCTSNLKQIGYACALYAKDNADAFPRELATLFPDYVSDWRLLVCPTVVGDGHVPNPRSYAFVPDAVCYAYVSGLRATDDADFVFAFDEEWNHGRKGVVVANVGGQVRWRSDIEAFHAKLEEQRAALAAEGREMRIIRPPWSREPDAPAYPVRPWHERPVVIVLMIFGGTAAVALVAWRVVRARRRRYHLPS